MTRKHTHRFVLGALIAALSLPGAGLARLGQSGEPRDYVFVYLITGPTEDLTEPQQQEAFAGHFSNMTRMAEAGDLLMAGPFGDPKSDPKHRGLFLIDSADLAKGLEITSSDPTTRLGVFVQRGYVFSTDAPLTELTRLEAEAEAERQADPDTPEYAGMRGFMLVTAPYSPEALADLDAADGVLVAGRLHGSGPDETDQVLAWLDAEDAETAQSLLPESDGVEWTLHGWYGSTQIEKMAD